MSQQVARLGIAVDSQPVARARGELEGFVRAGRGAAGAADKVERSTGSAGRELGRFGRSAGAATATVSALGKAIGTVAVGLAGFASAQEAAAQARGFQSAMAEASTLIRGTRAEMSLMEQEARRMTATFGGTAAQQVKAFYQAISAGADGVEAAAKVLDQANRLAIGGVTDVTTGVDALTTAINAYSATGLTAAEASDAMFVGMRAGKTTISELSAQMGQIVPIASAAGVSFEEMIAGISALTTQGQSTAMATTGLRAAITGILQPSKQASDAAKALGLEFSASALQAKGLEQFLAEVVKATGGSTDAMTQLFGSVEALNAVLAFSGAAGHTFSGIMADMGKKAGSTDAAYRKLAGGLDQRLNSVLGRLSNHALAFGNAILSGAVPAMEAFADGMDFMAQHSDALLTVIAGLTASMIPNAIAGLGTLSGTLAATAGAARGLAVAMWAATGPWGVLAGLVAAAGAAFVVFGKETKTFQGTMDELDAAQETLNTQVAAFATTYAPAAGKAAIDAANDYLEAAKAAREFAAAQLATDTAEMARIQGMIDNGHLRNLTMEEEAKLSARLHGAQSRLTVSQTAYDQALQARDETVKKVMQSDEAMANATKTLNSEINVAVKGLDGLGKGAGKAGKGLDEAKSEAEAFAEALKDAADTAEEMGTKKAGILVGGIDSMSDAWGDFVARGFRDFKGFADSVLDSFTGMLSQMIALAARNQILIGLGFGGSVAGTAASATGAAGGGGGLLNLLGGGANLLTGGGLLAGVAGGAGAALGIGGYASAGLFNIGANAALASAATGAGAFASTIGAALPALGVVAAGIAVLSKAFSREYRGSGIDAHLSDQGLDGGRMFDFYKGGAFRSDKWVHKSIPDEMAEALDGSMKAAAQSVLELSGALNLSTDGLKDMEQVVFSLWTNGKSEAEVQQALQDQITKTANEMAKLILTNEDYIRSSETHLEALQRLGTSLLAANDALDLLSHTLFDVSLAGGGAASGLVDAFGGADAMTAAVNAYFAAFYTAEEQAEALRRRALERLGEQFGDLGLSLPRSRAEFRALVESVDLTSEAGRELYAELLSLSGAMDQVLPKVSAYTAAMQGIVDQIGGEIGVQIGAARDMARITEQSAQLWYRTATTLRDFLSDLLNTDLTAASRSQKLAVNRSRFETAFDMARGGDVEAARDIPALAKAYLNSAQANASTSLEYRRIAAAVQGQVNFLAGIAELEGANDDVLRGLYEQQIEVLTGLGRFLQLEGLTDEQVGQLSDGVQALAEDWDGTVEAFEKSLGALEDAIKGAEAFSYDDLVGSLDVAVALADDAPRWLRKLVDSADSGIRTVLDFVIRRDDLTPADRWIATNAVSEHVAALDFVLRNDLDRQTRRLVLETAGQLNRDLSLTLVKDLDPDTREMLLARNQGLSRRVSVALTKEGDKTIRTLNRLQDLIGTSGNGKITFGGGLSLTADQAFKGLSDGVQDLVSPINKLRVMMGELREAVDADRQQREGAAKIAGLQLKGADVVSRIPQAQGVVDQFNALRGQYGIGLLGQDGTVSVNGKGRIETSFDYYSGGDVVGFKNALKKAFGTDSIGRVFAATNDRIGNAEDRAERLRQQIRDLGGIPSFANGGTHRGGLAHIGENDIELVAPSRIYNPRETKAMLDNREVVAELRAVRRELVELRDDNQQLMLANIKHAKRTADVQTRFERDPGSLKVTQVTE